jgi:hypothetical protein
MPDRLVRWLPVALVCGVITMIARRAVAPIRDPDDWWHLRLGNDLITQHSLATPENWSSFGSVSWVPTEPLPEVAAAYVERWLGLPGLAVLFWLAGLAVAVAVHAANRREARPLAASVATVFTVLAAAASLTSRPQLISFVLIPVLLAAWLQTERDLKPRWWLIPLVWAWSLCHGFWFLGAGLGCVVALGIALSRRAEGRALARIVAVALGSFAVVALNPVGLGVLEAPLAVRSTARFIQEWDRTDLMGWGPLGALSMIAVTAVFWVVTRRGATWSRVLLLVVAAVLVWYSARLVVVGALVAAPLFAATLEGIASRAGTDAEPLRPRREWRAIGAWALLCTFVVAVAAPHVADRPGDVPTALDPGLDRLPPGSGVLNAYELGGWLAWRHPDLEQYVDGLITPYSVAHVEGYDRVVTQAPGWYAVVRDADLRVALVGEDSALAAGLTERGWVTDGTSDGYVLLSRPA